MVELTHISHSSTGNLAPLVDKVVGSAYDVVREVAYNLEYIKHVSANLEAIYSVYINIDAVKIISDNLANIELLLTHINEVIFVSENMDDVLLVANNMAAIQAIAPALAQLQVIYQNLTSLLIVAENIDPIVATGDNIDSVVLIANNLSELLTIHGNLAAILSLNPDFATRAALVSYVAANPATVQGRVYTAAGYQYVCLPGSTMIPDLPGIIPMGRATFQHFGAVGDGVSDDTTKVQTALNTSQPLHVPFGVYRLTAPMTITKPIWLDGDGVESLTAGTSSHNTRGAGSWLFFDHTGVGFLMQGATARNGSFIRDLGSFRPQPVPVLDTDPFVPIIYDWDFYSVNFDIDFIRVVLLNAYRGIRCGSARVNTSYIYGQPLETGIQVDNVQDTCKHENNHFWPFWSGHLEIKKWVRQNGRAYVYGRGDGHLLFNCFALGYFRNILLTEIASVAGSAKCPMLKVTDCYWDGGGPALYVDETSNAGSSVWIKGGVTQGDTSGTLDNFHSIDVVAGNTIVTVDNFDMRWPRGRCVNVTGTDSRVYMGRNSVGAFISPRFSCTGGGTAGIYVTCPQVRIDGASQIYTDAGNVYEAAPMLTPTVEFMGLGTATPAAKLHVYAPLSANEHMLVEVGNNGTVRYGAKNINGTVYFGATGFADFAVKVDDPTLGTNPLFIIKKDGSGAAFGGTGAKSACAALEVVSLTGGFMPPRLSVPQRDAIPTPINGLVIFNTAAQKLQVWISPAWVDLH